MREFYRLVKVNGYGEEIDYIDNDFDTAQEAKEWFKRFPEKGRWEIRRYKVLQVIQGMKF